ncbi:hypothetical protein AVO42_11540 [Thiomicrospira sp. XS5]|uniref:glycosyltransferase family 9 protein n=1 Tax=Thiomicrospira sp. XS5 TaxID=1775636 RepID=UPI00074612CD|nr:hypothetical protein [Thiomicrospira sp. XS5]KUJ75899.1 hypothetical protein AVO42_11540 [Thiomicrospira sp. XS5]
MLAYFVNFKAGLAFGGSGQAFEPVPVNGERVPPACLYVNAGGHYWALKKSLCAEVNSAVKEAEPLKECLPVSEGLILELKNFPPKFGRESAKLGGDALHSVLAKSALPAQLRLLRKKRGDVRSFRFALVNGLGMNLGDTLVGLTALRVAHRVMEMELQAAVSFDFLLGVGTNDYVVDLIGQAGFPGRVFRQNRTVAEFSEYDGFFDFSNLIHYARYKELPAVDWFLWWLGLDYELVPPQWKRNQLVCDEAKVTYFHEKLKALLHERQQSRAIYFNPQASTPLRSFPEKQALAFVQSLAELRPDWLWLSDQKLAESSDVLVSVQAEPHGVADHIALQAACHGMVTVDTFSLHVADALHKPCVALCSSVPANYFRYYETVRGMDIPGMSLLPGYGASKVTQEQWQTMSESYAQAWSELSPESVIQALEHKFFSSR